MHQNEHVEPVRSVGFLNHTSIYGLELAVAMIAISVVASVLSFASYALLSFISGSDDRGFSQFALWTAATAIVWVPVAFIFYVRSRGYMQQNPSISGDKIQRVFVVIYQVLMILAVIGFAFTTVYSLFSALASPMETTEVLLRVTLPSFMSAMVFLGAFVAFFRKPVASRGVFAASLIGFSALLIIPVIVLSIVNLRQSQPVVPSYYDTYKEDGDYNKNRYEDRYDYNDDRYGRDY